MPEMRKEVREQVLGQDANVSFDMVVEDEPGGYGGFVLAAPPLALALGQVDRGQRSHEVWVWRGGEQARARGEANDSCSRPGPAGVA